MQNAADFTLEALLAGRAKDADINHEVVAQALAMCDEQLAEVREMSLKAASAMFRINAEEISALARRMATFRHLIDRSNAAHTNHQNHWPAKRRRKMRRAAP